MSPRPVGDGSRGSKLHVAGSHHESRDITRTEPTDAVPALFEPSDADVEVQVRYREAIAPMLADFVLDVYESDGDVAPEAPGAPVAARTRTAGV